jgi:hypothetical protein
VDIIRYHPERYHFLRFYYPGRVEDDHLLMTRRGEYRTTVRYAKEWVRDEFQVAFPAWEPMSKKRRGAGTRHVT